MIQDEYTDSQSLISGREEIDHAYLHEHGIEHCHEHSHSHEHMHDHGHVHSPEEKKAVINRLSKAIGHLEAVKRMVEKDADCSDVLIQLAAVRSAINNTGKVVLKNHLNHCIVEAVEENDMEAIERLNQAIDKFMK
ncbi:metal-sensing transcriptional repressor [Bariatricus sp. SGI.161]|uniref:metal-sensing transcriptional repressor n=1 Tax=Bariatricus sp. SGI.161 TaxID=3420550 RepID=UPI003D07B5B3